MIKSLKMSAAVKVFGIKKLTGSEQSVSIETCPCGDMSFLLKILPHF